MIRKCNGCRFLIDKDGGYCDSRSVKIALGQPNMTLAVPLTTARDTCNKEGDGIFVYFEPKTPAAGAAVQPDDWRKQMHKHMTKAA